MFKVNEKILFLNLKDGIIEEGKFIEDDKSSDTNGGIWIKINGQTTNTFVFSDRIGKLIFLNKSEASAALESIKEEMKVALSEKNTLIADLRRKLEKSEDKLYVDIIKELLAEKLQ